MNNDLISRSALKKAIDDYAEKRQDTLLWQADVEEIINNAPTVEYPFYQEAYQTGHEEGKNERPQGEWIPIVTRPLTEEEEEEYPDFCFMYDCKLPEDGEEVLVTTSSGYVTLDVFCCDDSCYFENYCDQDDVLAWQPLPKPYEGGKDK